MDRKTLVRAAKSAGWTGKTLDSLKEWAESEGIGEFRVGKDAVSFEKIDEVWGKTVTISVAADAGEDVVVNDGSAQTEEMDEDEDLDAKAEDEVEDEDRKQFEAWKRANATKKARSQDNIRKINKINADAVNLRTSKTGYNSGESRLKKMYDNAAKNGDLFRGKRPIFTSADEAEYTGAAIRLTATKGGQRALYPHLNNDLDIVGKTAGSTTDNAWGGSLIVSETAPQIIDLLHQYGAARQLAGVTDMPDGQYDVKRKTSNMSFSYIDEGDTITQTNPAYDTVGLSARKAAGIALANNELLNDSAFSIAEEVTRSSAAGAGLFEDQEYFLGTYGTHGGLAGAIDSNSTYDATLSSGWEDYTIAKLQAWAAKVPAEAWTSKSVKIACSSAFYMAVLRRFALSAGGNTGAAILDGIGGGYAWDSVQVIISEVLPSTYTADQTVAYIGSFDRGTKFGVVRGSEELSASAERYWDNDQFAWRYKERIAFNFHDVGGTSSEVIALKD